MKAITTALATLAALSIASFAQGPRGGRGNEAPPIKVGSKLADVSAFDESGKPFPLREKLKDRPAVIVFGCLT